MSQQEIPILNLSEAKHKRFLIEHIKGLSGIHRIDIKRVRDQRSLSQNAYLWGVVYPCVAKGMSEVWGKCVGVETAHQLCKGEFLREAFADANGEFRGQVVRSTTELDVEEFGRYLDNVIAFALESLGVVVPPPSDYEEREKVPA